MLQKRNSIALLLLRIVLQEAFQENFKVLACDLGALDPMPDSYKPLPSILYRG